MYEGLALFYNLLTDDIDYRSLGSFVTKQVAASGAWKDYIDRGEKPILLDAGTGTGSLVRELSRDFDCIGLDISEEMLDVARNSDADGKVLWICQDMSKMDLYGSVTAAVSLTDSVNHLLTEKKLYGFFERAHNFLDPGGLLIFDILTEERFKMLEGGNDFFADLEGISCFWTGKFNKKSGMCTYNISCFRLTDPDAEMYVRTDDIVREKYWSRETVARVLWEAGFSRIRSAEGGSRGMPGGKTGKGRIYFICEKEY